LDTELAKGTLSLLILSLLSRRAMYGYEIAATVQRDTGGVFVWKEGSLYPSLHKLQAEGCLKGEWEQSEEGRKRRYYHLTPKGRAVLKEKVQAWEELTGAVESILEKSHG
jgi:PadR family transcriptional regulator PadR